MAYRDSYLSLDPTYRDAHGLPLLRITFDWHDNEYRMAAFSAQKLDEIVAAMKPESHSTLVMRPGNHYDTRIYQSTHTTGGAIMGSNPSDSVVNRVLPVLGGSEPVHPRRIRLSAEHRLQPDGPPGRTGLFLGGRASEELPQVASAAGASMTTSRWIVAAATAILLALAGAMGVASWGDASAGNSSMAEPHPSAELIARGAYLALMGDCAACHSVPASLRSPADCEWAYRSERSTRPTSRPIRSTASASSLLPTSMVRCASESPEGIRSIRRCRSPRMPTHDQRTSKALYAYFKHGVAPAAVPNQANDIVFPLSMRWPLTFGAGCSRRLPVLSPLLQAPILLSARRIFRRGLGHCGECHTPRAFTMQMKAASSADGTDYLSGAVIEGYFAPSLRSGRGRGRWQRGPWTTSLSTCEPALTRAAQRSDR